MRRSADLNTLADAQEQGASNGIYIINNYKVFIINSLCTAILHIFYRRQNSNRVRAVRTHPTKTLAIITNPRAIKTSETCSFCGTENHDFE